MNEASLEALRALSAGLFGNTKLAEVVLTLVRGRTGNAAEIAHVTSAPYSMVRDVLVRLEKAGVVTSVREGGPRSPVWYSPVEGRRWDALCALAMVLEDEARGPDVVSMAFQKLET